jgi:hypothetical protein
MRVIEHAGFLAFVAYATAPCQQEVPVRRELYYAIIAAPMSVCDPYVSVRSHDHVRWTVEVCLIASMDSSLT